MSRRVLVTGAAGFVGSNLVRALLARGDEVHALVRAEGDLARIAELCDRVSLERADLRDPEALRAALRRARPSHVIHAAAAGVRRGAGPGAELVESNVLGAQHLIDAAAELPLERLLYTGGSSEYGHKDAPMRESDLPEPVGLYGASKAAATLLFQQAARAGRVPAVVVRLFSVYGPGEREDRLVPAAIRAALCGGVLPLTRGCWRRDFVYVGDVAEACLRALEVPDLEGEIVNVGTGRETSNEELVEAVGRACGRAPEIARGAYAPHPTDHAHWVADVSKAAARLGWVARTALDAGLRETAAWLRPRLAPDGCD